MDSQYAKSAYQIPTRKHLYGDSVYLVDDPVALATVAKISQPHVVQPALNHYIRRVYTSLFQMVAGHFFARSHQEFSTRMKDTHAEGVFSGDVIQSEQAVVLVDLARAGMLPTSVGFDLYCGLLNPDKVRLDHIFISRTTNEHDQVTGAAVAGAKIGGGVDNAVVILPDPMLATGGSIADTIERYEKEVPGTAKHYISMHLMATPEGVQALTKRFDNLSIVTVRLDRGLSSEKALQAIPGTFPEEERGLNAQQYIVPGAGGVGELINNSFV